MKQGEKQGQKLVFSQSFQEFFWATDTSIVTTFEFKNEKKTRKEIRPTGLKCYWRFIVISQAYSISMPTRSSSPVRIVANSK